MKVGLSPSAAQQVRALLDKNGIPEHGLRVGVQGGGCSGFTYVMDFADSPEDSDQIFEFDHSVRVFVDRKSLLYLDGTEVDYVEGLQGAGFKFRNPNVDTTCGCGESFSM